MTYRHAHRCGCKGKKDAAYSDHQTNKKQQLKYINEAHEWMDTYILKGAYPDLYGFLILVDHTIPAGEIWNQLRFWSEQYLNAGNNRTHQFHKIIDEEIAVQIEADKRNGYRPYFCYKGCSHCCYQPVAGTDEEAQLIYSYCADNKISIDFKKIQRQMNYITVDPNNDFTGETNWNDQNENDQACVFLDKNDESCIIWNVRPFVCRSHLAEKTNEYCKSYNGVPNPNASGIHYLTCSYILSSIFTIHHNSIGKMMGKLLLDTSQIDTAV